MGKLNKVMLIGNTGDDIQMHHFDNGDCLGRVPLATSEVYKNKQGEKVENTEWHNLVFRNKGAETIEKYAPKGTAMYVEGSIKTRKWQDDKGNDRYSTEIHVRNFEFLDSKKEQNGNNQKPNPVKPEPKKSTGNDDGDDDLPF